MVVSISPTKSESLFAGDPKTGSPGVYILFFPGGFRKWPMFCFPLVGFWKGFDFTTGNIQTYIYIYTYTYTYTYTYIYIYIYIHIHILIYIYIYVPLFFSLLLFSCFLLFSGRLHELASGSVGPDGSALPNFWDLGNEAERCRLRLGPEGGKARGAGVWKWMERLRKVQEDQFF